MSELDKDLVVTECEIGGRRMTIETGKIARQANGCAIIRYGDTMVLVASTAAKDAAPDSDFFPLTVDFREKMYAAGKVPGGFFKREGRPSTKEIITSRLIDRPIRPLFPDNFRNETQVLAMVLSYDQVNNPDILGIIGASASLLISDIPFSIPVGAVRIGMVEGQFIVNPNPEQLEKSALDLVVAGTLDAICMVESSASELSEDQFISALELAHSEIRRIIEIQVELARKIGKTKALVPEKVKDCEFEAKIAQYAGDSIEKALMNPDKLARQEAVTQAFSQTLEKLAGELGPEGFAQVEKKATAQLDEIERNAVRSMIVDKKLRVDGRALDEIRPIYIDVGLIPRLHGSALFTRGQTQSLSIVTLGSARDEQIIDGLEDRVGKRFLLHYNFPSFCTGEVKRNSGPGRREIGHGFLAERAIQSQIPNEDDFPYTIRVVSEIMESNGSSSMATVCGASLSLMDAGVPLKKAVAGVAMGLVMEEGKYSILTDIQGLEDHLGDMDFKVAGTKDGITALQMDIKVTGINREIMAQALSQAKTARLFLLDKMDAAISLPRTELSPYAPRILTIFINPAKIGTVIGPGGKMIKEITEKTAVEIEIDDSGRIDIISNDSKKADMAVEMIKQLTDDVEIGKVYKGKVTRVMNFGAFVQILPGQEGLVHISQLDTERVDKVEDICDIGDEILVKVTEIDNLGRINLSRKAVLGGDSSQSGESQSRTFGEEGESYAKRSEGRERPRHGDRKFDRGGRGDRNKSHDRDRR